MNSPEVYATVFALGPGKKDVNVIWAGSDDGLVQRHARRRQDVDERHAEGHAGLRPRQPDRRVGVRRRHGVRRGEEAAARRLRARTSSARTTSARRGRRSSTGIRRQRLRARRPRGSGAARAALRRHAARLLRLVRRRRSLAVAVARTCRTCQVSDIWVEANSIAIATHGRGFYVLDDIEPLRQYADIDMTQGVHLFKPGDATRAAEARRSRTAEEAGAEAHARDPRQPRQDGPDDSGRRAGRGAEAAGADARARGSAPAGRAGHGGDSSRRWIGRTRARRPADRVDGRGPEPRRVEPSVPGRNDVPGHGPLGRDDERAHGAAGHVSGAADGGRQVADAAAHCPKASRCTIRATPTCASSSSWRPQIRDKVSEANNAVIQIRKIKDAGQGSLEKSQTRGLKTAGDKLSTRSQRGRGRHLPGAEPERPGSAQLPDQDQQPPRVAAA